MLAMDKQSLLISLGIQANQMEEVARTVCLCLQVQTLPIIELGMIGAVVINSISFVNSL